MEIALLILLFALAFTFYLQYLDEPKRKLRENRFNNISELDPELKQLILDNKKIEAIKAYRRIYSAGLKEAHDVVSKHLPKAR